jgi:hypothetical protein
MISWTLNSPAHDISLQATEDLNKCGHTHTHVVSINCDADKVNTRVIKQDNNRNANETTDKAALVMSFPFKKLFRDRTTNHSEHVCRWRSRVYRI